MRSLRRSTPALNNAHTPQRREGGRAPVYKLISAHGSIRARCEVSWGNAVFTLPNNVCVIFLADYGSALTTRVGINRAGGGAGPC